MLLIKYIILLFLITVCNYLIIGTHDIRSIILGIIIIGILSERACAFFVRKITTKVHL